VASHGDPVPLGPRVQNKGVDSLYLVFHSDGGLAIMTGLLEHLAKMKIRPMICGYDIPIFAGDGPIKMAQPARQLKTRVDGEWKAAAYDDPAIDGRKLVIKKGRQSLVPIKAVLEVDPAYKNKHKKVLCLDEDGKIMNALAGWSAK